MHIDFFIKTCDDYKNNVSIIWKNKKYSYGFLKKKIENNLLLINKSKISKGSVVSIEGDFSPNSIAVLFSLINNGCIIVPTINTNNNKKKLYEIAQVEYVIKLDNDDEFQIKKIDVSGNNNYYKLIRSRGNPGLVIFSSGTSGKPKAAVHDFLLLLKKFSIRRKSLRTLNFLLFDHWGGLNTMFHILSNGGTLIPVQDRKPNNVCKLIQKHKIELLPVSPTFLNLLLLSKAYKKYNLNSLKIISYGTEPMPETTLIRLKKLFPKVRLLQTYGLIELGVMQSKSESDSSLWVKIGGEGYKTRIINGILQVKAKSAMLGYLNAKSPFTDDGWFITGDEVLQKGDYIKILGRKSEIINVGGEKVYPQEVENIILEMKNISDVTVYGEKNAITGNIVCAKIQLNKIEDSKMVIKKIKKYCINKLAPYKVPIKIVFDTDNQYSNRYKKIRT